MKKVYRCEQCKTLYKTDKPMKECPFCKSEIDIEATRCPHCTSEIPEEEAAE